MPSCHVQDLGDWWLQQRRVDEMQQQQSLEERRFSRGAKSQWQRCEELEAESQARRVVGWVHSLSAS